MGKCIDLTGQKFGRLTVIKRAENCVRSDGRTRVRWLCKCDCGNEIVVLADSLKNDKTKSCGCFQKEKTKKSNTKHGCCKERIYRIWCNMKTRCNNEKSMDYCNYGGRGVSLYSVWQDSFKAFYDYVSKLEHFNEDGYTLDRIDNNGNYEPDNVRWADRKTQNENRRNNCFVTHNGKTQTLTQWAEVTGINYQKLWVRINYLHWDTDKALSTL